MSAGTKVLQLRDCLVELLRYAKHLSDCPFDVGGTCRCQFVHVRARANHLAGADPARTGGAGDTYSPRPKGAPR